MSAAPAELPPRPTAHQTVQVFPDWAVFVKLGVNQGDGLLGPDEVVPACAQACPAEAIVFGNLNDPASRVSRLHGDSRRYDLLHELNTRPRTAYLVKLRNPNPELA